MILQYAIEKIQGCEDIETVRSIANSVNLNQQSSKQWLVDHLKPYLDMYMGNKPKIVIAAGWHGLIGHMLDMDCVSFDMDPICRKVKLFPNVKYVTETMEDFDSSKFDVIICTSCEHVTDDVLNNFLAKRSSSSIVCLQSNDYFGIEGHINCKRSLDEFIDSVDIVVLDKFEFKTEKYTRFMVIGR